MAEERGGGWGGFGTMMSMLVMSLLRLLQNHSSCLKGTSERTTGGIHWNFVKDTSFFFHMKTLKDHSSVHRKVARRLHMLPIPTHGKFCYQHMPPHVERSHHQQAHLSGSSVAVGIQSLTYDHHPSSGSLLVMCVLQIWSIAYWQLSRPLQYHTGNFHCPHPLCVACRTSIPQAWRVVVP